MNLDIGIDLGTSSVLIYAKNRGIVLNEPSIIAVKARNGEVIAVGNKAYNILGKNPDTIRTI
ncbi:MAG: rod shape-determining protein [Oscillospiraceae bacterium]|nr:rod shape-determining protein [Oscillospiraceae bacterium]